MNTRSGALICGAYGMSNAGDEAILEAVVGEMRSIDPAMPLTVLSRTPQATAEKYGVSSLHMFDIPGFLKALRRTALYINGGGSLIQDVTSTRSLWYYLFTIIAARLARCRVLMYGCGIGPVRRRLNRRLTALVLNSCVDAITLREESSREELRAFGVTKPEIILASDPALTLSAAAEEEVDAAMEKLGLEREGRYLCLCLRSWPGFEEKAPCFAAAAAYAHQRYGLQPLFLSVNTKGDGQAAALAARTLSVPHAIVSEPMPTPITIGLIARMQAVVSIRLHGLIFAASQAVPVAGVVYDPKVSAFLDYIGQTNYLPLEAVTEESLCRLVDKAMAMDRTALAKATEELRAKESRNTDAARRLLENI